MLLGALMSTKFCRGAVVADSVESLDIALSEAGDAFDTPGRRGDMGVENEPEAGAPTAF